MTIGQLRDLLSDIISEIGEHIEVDFALPTPSGEELLPVDSAYFNAATGTVHLCPPEEDPV